MMRAILIVLLVILANSANSADTKSVYIRGNELVKWAKAYEKNDTGKQFYQGQFVGFIAAIHDVLESDQFCTGSRVSGAQLSAVVIKFINQNPELWSDDAYDLVIKAMKRGFPC